jgi:conserved domain protein
MNYIKNCFKNILSYKQRVALKKFKRKIVNQSKGIFRKQVTLLMMEKFLLKEFEIKKGDRLIVTSSFGNLNATFSPMELVELLKRIVTDEGVIMMPYYPPGNSYEWARKGNIFDMQNTKSSMGILTNVFAQSDGVVKSIHPTKAVCVWGKDAKLIVSGHENSTTPFYWDSPYGELLKLGSKSLGLGIKSIPIFHTIEDILLCGVENYYESEIYNLEVKIESGEIINVKTKIHDEALNARLILPGDYVKKMKCVSYIRKKWGYTFCYIIDNSELLESCKIEFSNEHTRLLK